MPKAYPIVATQYGELSEAEVMALQHGTPAVLVRDPLNKFDPNAIAVYIDGRRIGYIPKNQNKVLAQFIDQQGNDFGVDKLAMDGGLAVEQHKSIPAKFFRSPNSNFPMVEV